MIRGKFEKMVLCFGIGQPEDQYLTLKSAQRAQGWYETAKRDLYAAPGISSAPAEAQVWFL